MQQRDQLARCVASLQRQRDSLSLQSKDWERELKSLLHHLDDTKKLDETLSTRSVGDSSISDLKCGEDANNQNNLSGSYHMDTIEDIDPDGCPDEILRIVRMRDCDHSDEANKIFAESKILEVTSAHYEKSSNN